MSYTSILKHNSFTFKAMFSTKLPHYSFFINEFLTQCTCTNFPHIRDKFATDAGARSYTYMMCTISKINSLKTIKEPSYTNAINHYQTPCIYSYLFQVKKPDHTYGRNSHVIVIYIHVFSRKQLCSKVKFSPFS